MASVVFSLNGIKTVIQCTKDNKMKDICIRFASKVKLNINSLIFLYGGNQINYNLTFQQQANRMDNNFNQMEILVYQTENDDEFKCKKCGEKIELPFIDNIIKNNTNQKDMLIEMKNQLDNTINLNNINDILRKIKMIKILLDNLIKDNEKSITEINNSIHFAENKANKDKQYNFEIIKTIGFNAYQEEALSSIIVDSVKQNENYKDIANCIFGYCQFSELFDKGKWIISIGERDAYSSYGSSKKFYSCYFQSYKIILFFLEENNN